MFERFTERARQVVVLAQEEARGLKHNYIGTEHILLGLLREEEGLAARVLRSHYITVEGVRGEVVQIVGSGEEVISGQIPFTPRAKNVLELALREALSLGHNHIATEHILLGLVRENGGVAARILLDFDADPEKIRNEILRMLNAPGVRGRSHGVPPLPAALSEAEATHWLIGKVSEQITSRLGRPADAGDLLLALASMSDGLAARTLTALGITPQALTDALDKTRSQPRGPEPAAPSGPDPEIVKVRAEKEAKIAAQEFEAAADLRDRERELVKRARERPAPWLEDALVELRARLGLGEPPGSEAS